MRFYKIDTQGPMFLNRGTSTPGASAANEGRLFYDTVGNGGEVFYADAAAWIRMYSNNNLAQLIVDIDAQGAWIRKDQDDTTAFRLTVSDGVIGDVRATDGTLVLENGTDGTDAEFTGDVKAQDANDIIFSGADRANSWASLASIKATDGTDVLVTNTTVANSTFAGISERAKYA